MADTAIEWTHRPGTKGMVRNPTKGCSVYSEGCKFCYAMQVAGRRLGDHPDYKGLVRQLPSGDWIWTGKVNMIDRLVLQPLAWEKPRTVFVNSMSDLFHEEVTDDFLARVIATMIACPQHTFQVLTKRSENLGERLGRGDIGEEFAKLVEHTYYAAGMREEAAFRWPASNIWWGVSIENQRRADEHLKGLKQAAASGHFTWVSNEPCLEAIDWIGYEFIRWMVTGGESGDVRARPMFPSWVRSTMRWCAAHGIPFFFKQWGEWAQWQLDGPGTYAGKYDNDRLMVMDRLGSVRTKCEFRGTGKPIHPDYDAVIRIGKQRSGNTLDGTKHLNWPA